MSIDLNGLSAKELATLINQAKKQRIRLAKRKPAATVRRQISAILKKEGYELGELFGGAAAKRAPRAAAKKATTGRKLGKVAPKYRNPANPKETWTGRGKQPRWLAALTAKGKKLEEFLIAKPKK